MPETLVNARRPVDSDRNLAKDGRLTVRCATVQRATGYDIMIEAGLLTNEQVYGDLLPTDPPRQIAILSDETVASLYLDSLSQCLTALGHRLLPLILPRGEATKSFACYEQIMNQLIEAEISRSDCLIALGGGVIGDLTGFCAATLRRGVPFIQIPTTLLAQVDSSVGGKTAINSPHGKNLIGAFYQPQAVLIDPSLVASLPLRELQAGFAEVIKYGLINDRAFFADLEDHAERLLTRDSAFLTRIIAHSCAAKAAIVARDEQEAGERALLNLGHTFGHAIEKIAGYDGRIRHGEAVAIGCVMALAASERLGLAPAGDADRLISLLRRAQMSHRLPDFGITTCADALIAAMAQDKKITHGQIVFILGPIGAAQIRHQVDLSVIHTLLDDMINHDKP